MELAMHTTLRGQVWERESQGTLLIASGEREPDRSEPISPIPVFTGYFFLLQENTFQLSYSLNVLMGKNLNVLPNGHRFSEIMLLNKHDYVSQSWERGNISVAVVTALAVAVLLAYCDLIVLILKLTILKLRESRGLI